MKRNCFCVFLIFIVLLSGCAKPGMDLPVTGNKDNLSIREDKEADNEPNIGEQEEPGIKNTELIDANKRFSWELFKTINQEDYDKEIFMSPLSVSGMLMMAYNGAEGTTRSAMAKAMHYEGISTEDLNVGYKYLISRLNNIDAKVKIEIANSIWLRKGFEIKQSFIDINRNYLFADVKSLDFSSPESVNEINNWVAKKTNNLIQQAISPPIANDVMMYLINAIYFKGKWTDAFKTRDTFEADFFSYDKLTDKVQMMQRTGAAVLAETDDYRAVSLPYGDGKIGMTIILPNKDINEFISKFDYEKWDTLLKNFKPIGDLRLQLPRFKMEYGVKDLKRSLASLGMGELFSGDANFSGISDGLYINSVLHKAIIDVNEEGTEAAAVTVADFLVSYSEPVKFIVNRPFIFVIYDTEEGNILFIGKKLYGDRA